MEGGFTLGGITFGLLTPHAAELNAQLGSRVGYQKWLQGFVPIKGTNISSGISRCPKLRALHPAGLHAISLRVSFTTSGTNRKERRPSIMLQRFSALTRTSWHNDEGLLQLKEESSVQTCQVK
jgi:hypothetical protein